MSFEDTLIIYRNRGLGKYLLQFRCFFAIMNGEFDGENLFKEKVLPEPHSKTFQVNVVTRDSADLTKSLHRLCYFIQFKAF